MKRKGFTLIEIVSSLLIFAVCGTMALSIFNFNASNRVEIMERMEASDLASGILNTLVLRSQTDPEWETANSTIKDGNTWRDFEDVPIQSLEPETQSEDVKRNSISLNGAANFLKSVYNSSTKTFTSAYQWRYRLIPATEDTMQIKKTKILHRLESDPDPEDVSISDHYILQVEVSWPRDAITDEEADEHVDVNGNPQPLPRQRKKVLLNTVVSCPA